MKRPALAFALTLASALPCAVHAVEYSQVHADKSSIGFTYKQMGVAAEGRFRKFSAQLAFDPAKPAQAKATLELDLASVDTGSSDADQEVAGKPWFNTRAFPGARFVADGIKPLGGNRYEVAGKLSIKGRTQEISAPLTFSTQGDVGVFDGGFTLRRADFGIGEGSWAAFDVVANDIQIKFRILASGK